MLSVVNLNSNGEKLLVSDTRFGRILSVTPRPGVLRPSDVRVLQDDLCPHGLTTSCVPDTVAVVHSTQWDNCVKLVSTTALSQVHASWGRDMERWTPRALATTTDGHLVVSNIHKEATSRIDVFTADGRKVGQ